MPTIANVSINCKYNIQRVLNFIPVISYSLKAQNIQFFIL